MRQGAGKGEYKFNVEYFWKMWRAEEVLPARTAEFDTRKICNGVFSDQRCYQYYSLLFFSLLNSGFMSLYPGGKNGLLDSIKSCLN